jgi:hypothetical protein
MITLDYNIELATDRCTAVCTLDLVNATDRDLEKVANYILYGKTPKGEALPEAKEITPQHSNWGPKKHQSLDELMENVMFDETSLRPLSTRSPYLKGKPKISREKDKGIPGMAALWFEIDSVAEQLKKEEEENGKTLKASHMRHLLIDLRKEQYHLKDLFEPNIHFVAPMSNSFQEIDWASDSGYLLPDGSWHVVAEHTIDLTNPTHIYHVLENYSALRKQCAENPLAPTRWLLHAVERLVEKAHLAPIRKHILVRKIDKMQNEQISEEITKIFGVDYAFNYISTIWAKEICGDIAEAGITDREEYAARKLPHKWKTCIKCHTRKLKTDKFFAYKKNTFDGLSPVCRECQREVRRGYGNKAKNNTEEL